MSMGETADLSPIGVLQLYSTSTTAAQAAGAAISTAEPARAAANASAAVRFWYVRYDTAPSFLTAHQIGRQGTPGTVSREDKGRAGSRSIRRVRRRFRTWGNPWWELPAR